MGYQLQKQVRRDENLRKAYGNMAEKVFGLDFEAWYQKGYWTDTHIPYTLFDGENAVANVSVNRMELAWQGSICSYIQLGTVMTDPDYRNQGLCRYLMGEVLKDWKDNCAGMFLFANEHVLDFYPKFGFERQVQYGCSQTVEGGMGTARRLEIEQPQDMQLLQRCYEKGNPFSKLQVVNGFGLLMFYCGSFLKNSIYYVKEQDAVSVQVHGGKDRRCRGCVVCTERKREYICRTEAVISGIVTYIRRMRNDTLYYG